MQATQDSPLVAMPSVGEINTMITELFPGAPHQCVDLGDTWALAKRNVTEAELRPGGFVSGPTQFGLADTALWYLVFGATRRIEPMALTSELSIRYLRPAQGTTLWARADLDVAGRRNVVGTVRVWCDDNDERPTATAQGTYVLPH
ncbi:MAG: PaaI family thioesterase [Actinomycetota bacterium]